MSLLQWLAGSLSHTGPNSDETSACNIIQYWHGAHGISNAAWIVPMLVALLAIQFFGVRGYGEASLPKFSQGQS